MTLLSESQFAANLAGIELQLCNLVHCDWLTALGLNAFEDIATSAGHDGFHAVISRHLIEFHKLVPLEQAMFSDNWTYAVAGGHEAVSALARQITSYLISTCVHRAISGEQARALFTQFGKEVYNHALREQKPLHFWAGPKVVSTGMVQLLGTTSQDLLNALWACYAPELSHWASLMSPTKPTILENSSAFLMTQNSVAVPHSNELLKEIAQRLQVDLEIDIEAIFTTSCASLTSLPH